MSDNTVLNPGEGGDVIASDDIGGVKFQRIKLTLGGDGVNGGDVASDNPMPVALQAGSSVTVSGSVPVTQSGVWSVGRAWNLSSAADSVTVAGTLAATQSGAWDVRNITGTVSLPTGAATAAKQLPDNHQVTVSNFPATQAVTQSGAWDIRNVTGTVSLPTGAATAAKQLPDNHQVAVSNFPANQSVSVLNQLVPTAFNAINLTYNGDGSIATVTYKQGATTVATLTLGYTAGNLTSVVRT